MAAQRQHPNTVEAAFGLVLRQLRADASLSQEALGHLVDSGRTYASELERGQKGPTLAWIFRVAAVLGVKPSEVVARVESAVKT